MSSPATPHVPVPNNVSLLPVLRALVECQRAVERVAGRHIETMGLTHSQFDVLVTLGDTPGLTHKAIGEQTLITKGTLTPVLDRMEAKGLVRRVKGEQDRRQSLFSLTPQGQALYARTFMPHVEVLRARMAVLAPAEQDHLVALLQKLKRGFA